MTIVSEYLHQPAAPRFFQVDVEGGRALFITFRGLGWIEYQKNLAEPRGGARSQAQAGSNPAAADNLTHGGQPKQETPGAAGCLAPSGVIDKGQRPPPTEFEKQQADGGGVKDGSGEFISALHARLDAARDAYDRCRQAAVVDAELYWRTQEAYCALIAAAAQADPAFYLGRVRPLKPPAAGERVSLRNGLCMSTLKRGEAA